MPAKQSARIQRHSMMCVSGRRPQSNVGMDGRWYEDRMVRQICSGYPKKNSMVKITCIVPSVQPYESGTKFHIGYGYQVVTFVMYPMSNLNQRR